MTYKTPGIYQWVKPSTTPGAGPFGSTYLQSILTCIGAGSGGAAGASAVGTAAGIGGGGGGNGGAYAQATYLPAALNATENITVGAGSPGGVGVSISSNAINSLARVDSLSAGLSLITSAGGQLINSPGGNGSGGASNATATINGGSNITSFLGCSKLNNPTINNVASPSASPSTGINVQGGAGNNSYQVPPGNNAGASGGCVNTTAFAVAHNNNKACAGGGINFLGGGTGLEDSSGTAGQGVVPGAGGGGAGSALAVAPISGGKGADATQSSGAGGGGGGGANLFALTVGSTVTPGSGGKGSDGVVQITDIFTMPPSPPIAYYNWSLVTWFHMANMARPISLTGRYKS